MVCYLIYQRFKLLSKNVLTTDIESKKRMKNEVLRELFISINFFNVNIKEISKMFSDEFTGYVTRIT